MLELSNWDFFCSNWDFKISMVKRFLKYNEEIDNLHEQMGNFNKKIDIIQKSLMENLKMKKKKILGIENTFSKFISKMDTVEKRIMEQTQKDVLVNYMKHLKKK